MIEGICKKTFNCIHKKSLIQRLHLLQCLPCRNNSDCIHYNTHNGPRGVIKRKDCLACRSVYCDICKRCVVCNFIGRHNQSVTHNNNINKVKLMDKLAKN